VEAATSSAGRATRPAPGGGSGAGRWKRRRGGQGSASRRRASPSRAPARVAAPSAGRAVEWRGTAAEMGARVQSAVGREGARHGPRAEARWRARGPVAARGGGSRGKSGAVPSSNAVLHVKLGEVE